MITKFRLPYLKVLLFANFKNWFRLQCCFLVLTFAGSPYSVAQLAKTPPMGWNSWNVFGPNVTDKDVRAAADALVTTGMRDAGYVYVNVDDGWQGVRDANGTIHGNDRFPDMKALVDYIHARGLKFGIYSSPGPKSCSGREGSYGHEEQDAKTFASWGVDYLKYDICSFRQILARDSDGNPVIAKQIMENAYEKMHRALMKTGRPIIFSMSQHGLSEVWKWGPETGAQLWRTGDDIHDSYLSITEIGFSQAGLAPYAAPGHWNDPDMLEIGNKGLNQEEARTQMSLWALLAAPLIAGNDLSKASRESLAILTNPEVIAIDQDRAGKQGNRVSAQGPIEIWVRSLANGSKAVGIFNRNAGANVVTLNLKTLGFRQTVSARDVWGRRELSPIDTSRAFLVSPHGVVLLVLKKIGAGSQ
jgi:alpha-galactosidase